MTIMFKWFNNINTIDDLKKSYRKLAVLWHPDICKDINADQNMKEINNEYEQAFDYILKHATTEQQKTYTRQGHNVNDGYREAIEKIIHIPNIEIEICGSWIWVGGDTTPVKEQLSDAGYHWAYKKIKWYWRPEEYKSYNRKPKSMDYIRSKYGSERIYNKPYEQIDQTA